MKNLVLALALLVSSVSFAAAASATPVRVVYNCCNVVVGSWTSIVPSLIKSTKSISLYNSGSAAIQVGIGAVGSEVANFVIPPSSSILAVYPFVVSGGNNISIKPLASTGGSGELEANFIYN